MTPEQLEDYIVTHGHCSSIVKVADDFSDIFGGHSTWASYSTMLRVYKFYNFQFNNPAVVAKNMAFSSYYGTIVSTDDFYMMSDSDLLMLETTNGIYNYSLYDLITPQSLYAWQRVRMANHVANSGKQWYEVFKKYNSGTYNNQYMIVDYKLFEPHNALKNNTLWIIE